MKLAGFAVLILAGAARAQTLGDVDARVSDVVRARYAEIRRCYDRVLARDFRRGGSLALMLSLGKDGRGIDARIDRDDLADPDFAACVRGLFGTFSFPGLPAGAEVGVPLRFDPPARQHLVRVEDVPAYPILGGKGKACVLLDEASVGATEASMSWITLEPGARIPLHLHDVSGEVFYLAVGRGRMRGAAGTWRIMEVGTAVYVPAGAPHAFETLGREPVAVVQWFVPGGPERCYRDPANADGTVPIMDEATVPRASPPTYGAITPKRPWFRFALGRLDGTFKSRRLAYVGVRHLSHWMNFHFLAYPGRDTHLGVVDLAPGTAEYDPPVRSDEPLDL